jgi:hypothetical protein
MLRAGAFDAALAQLTTAEEAPLDDALARATYLETFYAVNLTDRADGPRVARAARELPPPPSRSRMDLLRGAS